MRIVPTWVLQLHDYLDAVETTLESKRWVEVHTESYLWATPKKVEKQKVKKMQFTAYSSVILISVRVFLVMERGGYPLEWFVGCEESLRVLVCSICIEVCRDAQQCLNGHIFCKSCIAKVHKTKQSCPECNSEGPVFNSLVARNVIHVTSQMRVSHVHQPRMWMGGTSWS